MRLVVGESPSEFSRGNENFHKLCAVYGQLILLDDHVQYVRVKP